MRTQATESVCPTCLRRLPAVCVERDGNIYLERTCPEHGLFSTLVWEGTPDFWSRSAPHTPTRELSRDGVVRGCPFDCGICSDHRQRTCCVLLEVTQRCNLCCPVCFADSGFAAADADPDLTAIGAWYDAVMEQVGKANIQLSGGEPTVRDDLSAIIRLGREKGFSYFQLNTNGRRLAREPDYAKALAEAGVNCVFLQFDGVTDEVYEVLRGTPLLEEKIKAIENCEAARLPVMLVPVVAPGVNLDQVGAILRFAMQYVPAVRGVHFQPIAYFGRYPGSAAERLTLPRLLREIERQTDSAFRVTDFTPAAAEHPLCSFSGSFLLGEKDAVTHLQSSGSCSCCTPGESAVEHVRDSVARRWGAEFTEEEAPPDPASLDAMAYRLKNRRFSVSAMAFQDCWSLDLERLRNCHINIVSPEGKMIPFCAYNLTDAAGRPLYRKTAFERIEQ